MRKVLIIGAGIVGTSTAFHLASSGAAVTVVDRNEPGQATKAAAGIICPWVSQRRNKAWYALAKAGAAYYPEFIRSLGDIGKIAGYKQAGALAVRKEEAKLVKLKELAELRKEDSPEIGELNVLTAEQTLAQFPPLHEEFQSVKIGGAARVDGKALRDALETAAIQKGAVFREGSAVPYVEGGIVRGVELEGERLSADIIILAAGAWAVEFVKPLGLELLVAGQKAQILHLQIDDETTGNWPVIMPPSNQYMVPFDGGKIVAGATYEETDVFDVRPTAGGVEELLAKALSIAPGLGSAAIQEVRVGIRPQTPAFMPIIGDLPGFPNVLLANGLGSSGLTVGPFVGRQLAKLALGEAAELDLTPYNVAQALQSTKDD